MLERGLAGLARGAASKNVVGFLGKRFRANKDLVEKFANLGARGPDELVERFLNKEKNHKDLELEIEAKKADAYKTE